MAGNFTKVFGGGRLVVRHDRQEEKILHLKRDCFLSPFGTGVMLLAIVDTALIILYVLVGLKAELSVESSAGENSWI